MTQQLAATTTAGLLEWTLQDSNSTVLRKKLIKASDVRVEYELDKQREVETLKFYHGETELMGISSDSQSPDYKNFLDGDSASLGINLLYDKWFSRYAS